MRGGRGGRAGACTRTKFGTMIACAMKSEIVYAAYPFEVATGRYHLVLGLGSPLGLGLHFALHLPKARPYSRKWER